MPSLCSPGRDSFVIGPHDVICLRDVIVLKVSNVRPAFLVFEVVRRRFEDNCI